LAVPAVDRGVRRRQADRCVDTVSYSDGDDWTG
jgi:hypothetical protein